MNETKEVLNFAKQNPWALSDFDVCMCVLDAHNVKNVKQRNRFIEAMMKIADKRGIRAIAIEAQEVRKKALEEDIRPDQPCCSKSCEAMQVAAEFLQTRHGLR